MDAALKELLQYGVLGIILVLAIWYILKKDSAHKDVLDKHEETILEIINRHENERKETKAELANLFMLAIKSQEKTTYVISELSEIIKNRIPR